MAVYSTKLGEQICERTACSSIGLRHICKELGLPYSTVTNWIYDEDHELHAKYAKAKIMQLDYLAEEILNIADDSSNDYMTVVKNGKSKQVLNREAISRSNLRIRARLMLIAKLSPIHRGSKKNEPENKQRQMVLIKRVPPCMDACPMKNEDRSQWYKKTGDLPVEQGHTLLSPDAVLKNKSTLEDQKNIGGSSPKNTPKPTPEEPWYGSQFPHNVRPGHPQYGR